MTEHPTVVVALCRVMEDVRAVRKGDRNRDQGYNFRGVDAVVNAVGPALRKHGVLVVPVLEEANYRDVTTSRGKPSRECTVKVRYRFYGPAGDFIEAVTPGESMDFGDKGAPKAMSVAFRIALLQALALPTDESDPDAHSYERAEPLADLEADADADADVARDRLRATCEQSGWDLNRVATIYTAQHGHDLRSATDATAITRFRDALFAMPETELRNGVVA